MKKAAISPILVAVALLAVVVVTEGQQPAKEARIGVLGAPEEPRFSEVVGGLKKGLTEFGLRSGGGANP